jgi:hypothetical protein
MFAGCVAAMPPVFGSPPGGARAGPCTGREEVVEEALTDKVDALRKESTQLKIEAGKRSEVDFRSDISEIERYLRSRILSEHAARRMRDVLLELYPLPPPSVPVTHPNASTDDDIGLH